MKKTIQPHETKEKKSEYKPNYVVDPMEILADFCLYSIFGNLVARFEKEGITKDNVYLITAIFPKTPAKFWLNLQEHYDSDKKRLNL